MKRKALNGEKEQVAAAGRRVPPAIKKMFLLVASTIIVLTAAEIILALAGVEKLITLPDPLLGHFHIPGIKFCIRRVDYKACNKFNRKGLNDEERPYAKKGDKLRVGFFGDSFVEAVQVPRKENFVTLIEKDRDLGCGERHVETLNFGVRGYSLANSLLMYETIGVKYDLDAVLLVLFVGNDIVASDKNLLKSIPGFVTLSPDESPFYEITADGQLRLIPFKMHQYSLTESTFKHFWGRVDFLSRYAYFGIAKSRAMSGTGLPPEMEIYHAAPNDPLWNSAYDISFRIIDKMRNDVESRGGKFLLVIMPAKEQVDPSLQILARARNSTIANSDLLYPNRKIAYWAKLNGVDCVDLAGPFSKSYLENKGLYLPVDAHLNADGHKLTASTLRGSVRAMLPCSEKSKPGRRGNNITRIH